MYGTDNGTLGHVYASSPTQLRKTWELRDRGGVGRGVTALKRYDLTQDGFAELIAGREDGTVTVSARYFCLFSCKYEQHYREGSREALGCCAF